MNPPIKVEVATDNLKKCELRISGADGVATAIVIPCEGNVYQGLHAMREQLETTLNDMLAMHGITAPPPPSIEVTVDTAQLDAQVSAKREELSDLQRKHALEDEQKHLDAELAQAKAEEAARAEQRKADAKAAADKAAGDPESRPVEEAAPITQDTPSKQ